MIRIIHICLSTTIKDNPITIALRDSGAEVYELDYHSEDGSKIINQRHFSKLCVEATTSYKPDFVFMQIQQRGIISTSALDTMTKICPVICFTGDVRDDVDYQKEIGSVGVFCLCNNYEDVNTLKNANINAEYLQIGFHKTLFSPVHNQTEMLGKIVFVGSNYGTRFPLGNQRISLCKSLKDIYGDDFAIYGLGWEDVPIKSMGMANYKDLSTIYSKYSIAINHSNYYREGYSSDRLFQILGSGAFCLSNYFPKIELLGNNGEHFVYYKTIEECVELCDFYLSEINAKQRQDIGYAGFEQAHKNLTWDVRVQELYQIINKYYNLNLQC